MLFNSIDFAIFLPIVFILYWFVFKKSYKFQNVLIVIASLVFYGWWDWRFLSLILASSILDYVVGMLLENQENTTKRKLLLAASLVGNFGLLGFFKYFNFFVDNFINAFTFFGFEFQAQSLNIILPVGISFYTFQTLSYSIDVYRRQMKPTRNFIAFMAFVSFFPQLVAGPIERAINLLPQFFKKRTLRYPEAVDGMKQLLWGFFKKIVIADNCAIFANLIFNNSSSYSGSTLLLGVLFFTFQIYCDFSGYSDIAIGTAKLLGFQIMTNFAFPYFSRDIAEFWRRWHISLSTWFRDYLYIPLGGSKGNKLQRIRNTLIIFIVSGFWHGANWTFIVWGALNAIYFLPLLLTDKNRKNMGIIAQGKLIPPLKELVSLIITFSLTVFAWIFFRALSLDHAFSYIGTILSPSLFTIPVFPDRQRALLVIILAIIFMTIEWLGREGRYAIDKLTASLKKPFRWAFYYSIVLSIYLFANNSQVIEFIYFQF
ncbi:MAG: MBOAT family protein [Spirochaetaceae bacterium]|nr:MAG: MBOAT family protein [Spirochaetaceae bacterium]